MIRSIGEVGEDCPIAVRAMYGSIEKMKRHPNWIECNNKRQYLINKVEHIKMALQMELDNTHPLNLYKRLIIQPIGRFGIRKVVIPEFMSLAKRYEDMLKLPIGFVLGGCNEDFDKLLKTHNKTIRIANKMLNIKDDIYVGTNVS